MPKSAILKRTDQNPPVRNGEFVATATVLQISQLAMTSPFVGDFQIIGQGRLIVGEHPDLGERFIVTSGGAFAFNAAGTRTFAVWTRGDGVHTGGDVYLGHPDNFLMYDQSEGTLGLYTAAGAGFIADSDGSLFAGDSDGAHMRWSSASRALEIRNGEDVKISLDANGDGFFDGTIYASGGRIYGQMQVDGLFRAGDVDGPSISLGRFERLNESNALVESSEIIATDAANLPWFHVVAGGSTAGGGWFQVGNPGDYAGRMTYDGETLQVANWIVDSERLRSPGGILNLSTVEGVQFIGFETTALTQDVGRMVTFWAAEGDAWPTHRISAYVNDSETPDNHRLVIQAQPLPDFRGSVYLGATSYKEAKTRVRAIGGYDTVNQQQAYIDLWAYREELGGAFTHSRIDLSADIVYPMPYTAATIPGGTIQNGGLLNSNGTYEPGAGAGLYAYFGGYWKPLALVADGWEALDVSDDGATAGNVQFYTCSASGGAFTVNLPAATAKPRDWEYTFYKSDSSANAVTIDADGAATINGAATYALTTQYQAVTIRRVGANWAVKSTA